MTNSVLFAYAAYSKSENVRLKSSSGAVFFHLATDILEKGGVVYGVSMSADCRDAEFICIHKKSDLYKLQGSKYLQAKIGKIFSDIKCKLEEGKLVLFTGTGCQVNGLKGYLGKEYQNLFCVDVICHGVPSAKLWRKYVDYVEYRNRAKLTEVNFRCKDDNWADFGMKEYSSNHKSVFVSKEKDPYMLMFLRNYSLRPSCYECVAKSNKNSDLTLADFWGIHLIHPDMDDGKGTSLVLIRTRKGADIFKRVCNELVYREVSYEDGIKYNAAEYKSTEKPNARDEFFSDMNVMDFPLLSKKYASPVPIPFVKRARKIVKKIIKYTPLAKWLK